LTHSYFSNFILQYDAMTFATQRKELNTEKEYGSFVDSKSQERSVKLLIPSQLPPPIAHYHQTEG